jgi:serpin B
MLSSRIFKSLTLALVISAALIIPKLPAGGPASTAAVSEVANANSQFALALYQNINADKASNGQNIFVSPYSISTALAMTYVGSRNNTQKQMASVLHFQMPDTTLEASYSSLLAQTQATPAKHYKLEVANALWGQEGFHFEPAFTTALSKYFGGGFNVVDFIHGREASRLKINKWVEDKTADKIRDLVHASDIDDLTRLILTNAIYFKGDWASKFEKETTGNAPFTVRPGKTVNVPMMEQEDRFPFLQDGELKMIELPYAGNDLAMIAILPASDAEKFSATLSFAKLHELRKHLYPQEVCLFLPRFKFETRYYLEQRLSAMGMPDAFDDNKADFSGLTGHRDFHLSHAIHQAMIDVNEEGSEAAAATAMIPQPVSIPPPPAVFRADHPFIFMIVHKPTDSILFIGRVSNPPAATSASPADAKKPRRPPPPACCNFDAVNRAVTLIPSGDYQPWKGPVQKGQMVSDNNVEGGLRPIDLAMPPVAGAPPRAFVVLSIIIDPNGNVSPSKVLFDGAGMGPEVMAAAKWWKFKPPTVNGTPVSTRTTVRVTF